MAMKATWRALFVTLLFLVMCSLLTLEKVSYIWTLRVLGTRHVSVSVGSAAILVLLLTPYTLGLLQAVWSVPFLIRCPDPRLPPVINILMGILSSLLEVGCVTWFTSHVASQLPVFVVIPALASVMALSSVSPWLSKARGPDGKEELADLIKTKADSPCCRARPYLALLCMLGPSLAAAILLLSGIFDWYHGAVLASSTFLLSVVWSPGVVYRTISVEGQVTLGCKRLGVFYAAVKVAGVFFFVGLDLVLRSVPGQDLITTACEFFHHFRELHSSDLVLPLFLSGVAGLFGQGFVYLSLAFCQPVVGILLPSLLSSVSSVALGVGFFAPHVYHVNELSHFGDLVPMLLAAGVLACTWAVSYVLRTLDAVRRPRHLFMPYENVLLGFGGWCAGFADQRRLLSFCADGALPEGLEVHVEKGKKSRVYVCTTMYREADYEMERLLLSLQGLSAGESLQHVYLEAHIFMDNGVNGLSLGDFAQQLVGLLISHVGLRPEEARCLVTPYGLQITCFFPGGMPLFVHFKDPAKVKSKKRWSQCLYLNYIMSFRKVMWNQNQDCSVHLEVSDDSKISIVSSESFSFKPCESVSNGSVFSQSDKSRTASYPVLSDFVPGFHDVEMTRTTNPTATSDPNQCPSTSTSQSGNEDEEKSEERGVINIGYVSNEDTQYEATEAKSSDSSSQFRGLTRSNTLYEFKFDPEEPVDDDHTYILATDADMDFKPEAVLELLHMCNSDRRLGAACGRTHPIGKRCSSIVWHQIFEYAKDFWMIKSAQNVIGSVMCCPGCFSLYRASAIRQVMDKYATPTMTPFTVYVKDTGEDRWMATLMMINGWRLRYSAFADNTTYCPDTFQEFFKQRRRWILSDIANAILVVQNLFKLLRNNECFTLVYIVYLVNMFVNNVITPGTAIVMITAGLELVFDVPYIYTTPPLAAVVYAYALLCTRASGHVQTVVTSALTVVLGSVFCSIAIWGSYKIVASMIMELMSDQFQLQQHYIILMLTISLLYAAVIHPRECHQIAYGLAYLFIFPAMHLLLPIYSVANIIDQSWGTRDSQTAKIPKLKCMPSFKKLMKLRKSKTKSQLNAGEDNSFDIQTMVSSIARSMSDGSPHEKKEFEFWESLRTRLLGNDVNTGLEKAELAERLRRLRNRSLTGLMVINALWLALLSYFYVGVESPMSRLNLYGVISGALYGFTLFIQVIGMTICRVNYLLRLLARYLYGDKVSMWVSTKDRTI